MTRGKRITLLVAIAVGAAALVVTGYVMSGCGYVPPTPDAGVCPPPVVCPPVVVCPEPEPEPPALDATKYAMQCGSAQWGWTFYELDIDPSECAEMDGPWGLDAGVEWRGVEHYCKCIVSPPARTKEGRVVEGERWICKGVKP